jgi:hypothetical protein
MWSAVIRANETLIATPWAAAGANVPTRTTKGGSTSTTLA